METAAGNAKLRFEEEQPTFVKVATAAEPGVLASYSCTEQPEDWL